LIGYDSIGGNHNLRNFKLLLLFIRPIKIQSSLTRPLVKEISCGVYAFVQVTQQPETKLLNDEDVYKCNFRHDQHHTRVVLVSADQRRMTSQFGDSSREHRFMA